MINELKGTWVVNEVASTIKDKTDFHAQYLPALNSEITAKLDVKASQLILTMDGGDREKIYEPMGFAGTTVFYMVEEPSPGVYLLDVVFFDLDMESGHFAMNHDYYWSDQTHWTAGDENENVKPGMSEEEVAACIVARYKLGVTTKSLIGSIYASSRTAPRWRCTNTGGQ